jgi:hypothetical protein
MDASGLVAQRGMSDVMAALSSRQEFQQALRQAFQTAAQQGTRELFISDPDFSLWPLGEVAVVQSLTDWAMSHRQITMLAQNYDDLVKRHPRFVVWRRQWAHVVHCRTPENAELETVPSMLIAPGLVTLRAWDTRHFRASVSNKPEDELQAREEIGALLQRSVDSFPASVLGL